MKVDIITLGELVNDRPQLLERIAVWHHKEWAHLNPGQTLFDRCSAMRKTDALANMFVAINGAEPVGTSAIEACDMATHPEYSPWLASVYVAAAHRGQGVARQLILHAMNRAYQQGKREMYLYTPNHCTLYEKLGWQVLSREHYHGEAVTVMRCDLKAALDTK